MTLNRVSTLHLVVVSFSALADGSQNHNVSFSVSAADNKQRDTFRVVWCRVFWSCFVLLLDYWRSNACSFQLLTVFELSECITKSFKSVANNVCSHLQRTNCVCTVIHIMLQWIKIVLEVISNLCSHCLFLYMPANTKSESVQGVFKFPLMWSFDIKEKVHGCCGYISSY